MTRTLMTLWNDEAGFILSAEIVLIATILILGLIVGLVSVRDAVNAELYDVAGAFRSLNQSYYYSGFHGWNWRSFCRKSWTPGSAFVNYPASDYYTYVAPAPGRSLTPTTDFCPGGTVTATPTVAPQASPCPEGAPCAQSEAVPAKQPLSVPCPEGAPCAEASKQHHAHGDHQHVPLNPQADPRPANSGQ